MEWFGWFDRTGEGDDVGSDRGDRFFTSLQRSWQMLEITRC
ncbi:hypothetical protein [Alkalinema sp. FACHB-956]|nr:hypothetical protein [Alkalinema sp. FACHB-956]